MKRKLVILIGMLGLALIVSVGTYASTYSNATLTLAATGEGDRIATSNVTSGQPDWESLMPVYEPGMAIMRPNGAGDVAALSDSPSTGPNWQKVADVSPDDWSTYVYNSFGSYKRDLYNLTDYADMGTPIDNITVYYTIAATSGTAYAQPVIKAGSTVYVGTEQTWTDSSFATFSYQWGSNPSTLAAWTWADINALQAGIQLYRIGGGAQAACTQVYVLIDYTIPPITAGDVPAGNLFTITPHPEYTGDLLVKIYVTNTGDLTKAYTYLNIKMYVAGSLETPLPTGYQILSLENGIAVFNIEGGTATSYTVQVTGGSYGLVSGDSSVWNAGWSLTPEFFCEVSER